MIKFNNDKLIGLFNMINRGISKESNTDFISNFISSKELIKIESFDLNDKNEIIMEYYKYSDTFNLDTKLCKKTMSVKTLLSYVCENNNLEILSEKSILFFKSFFLLNENNFEITNEIKNMYCFEDSIVSSCVVNTDLPSFYDKVNELVEDKDVVRGLYLKDKSGLLVGRCLLWNTKYLSIMQNDRLIPYRFLRDEEYFLDRIYPNDNNVICNLFKLYANKRNYLYKATQGYANLDTFSRSESASLQEEITFKLKLNINLGKILFNKEGNHIQIPYIDTFRYLDTDGRICNNRKCESFFSLSGVKNTFYNTFYKKHSGIIVDVKTRKFLGSFLNNGIENLNIIINDQKGDSVLNKKCPICGKVHNEKNSFYKFYTSYLLDKGDGSFSFIHEDENELCVDCFNKYLYMNKDGLFYILDNEEKYEKVFYKHSCLICGERSKDEVCSCCMKTFDNKKILNYIKESK